MYDVPRYEQMAFASALGYTEHEIRDRESINSLFGTNSAVRSSIQEMFEAVSFYTASI